MQEESGQNERASLCDIITGAFERCIEAGATVVRVTVTESGDTVELKVEDNGRGMSAATVVRMFDPFCSCGATVDFAGEKGDGTKFVCTFLADGRGLPPMGDVPSAVLSIFTRKGGFEFAFTHEKDAKSYSISRLEVKDVIEDLKSDRGLFLAKEFLQGKEESLR